MESTFKQSKKVGVAGSFINQMMGNNSSLPVVGQWATILHYTDRSVCKVVEVSKDGKTCKVESYEASADKSMLQEGQNLPMGHQCWKFEPTGGISTIVWFRGKWRTVSNSIVFTDEFIEKCPTFSPWRSLTEDQKNEIYQGQVWPQKVVEGITRAKKEYSPVSILFNTCDYYYDWSF